MKELAAKKISKKSSAKGALKILAGEALPYFAADFRFQILIALGIYPSFYKSIRLGYSEKSLRRSRFQKWKK